MAAPNNFPPDSGPPPNGPRNGGPPPNGPQYGGPRPNGPQHGDQRPNGPQHGGPPYGQPPASPYTGSPFNPSPPPAGGGKASKIITLSIIGVVSVMVVGFCAAQNSYEEVEASCVDPNSQLPDGTFAVVDEDLCDETHYRSSTGAYLWYYGASRVGSRIRGGTTIRPSSAHITTSSGHVIQSGGFGGRSGSSGS